MVIIMKKTADFLDKYDTVIFDMDGVITQEQQYWNTAALTVREFLDSEKYYGKEKINPERMIKSCSEIRNDIFLNDRLITVLKGRGVNSNWDLSYVTFALIILNDGDYKKALKEVESFDENILNEYSGLAERLSERLGGDCQRNGELWIKIRDCFQEWFLGDRLFEKVYGKKPISSGKRGLCFDETPIINREKLKDIFKFLHEDKKRLCIATGRPKTEMETPLESFGIMKYIDKNSLICYDYVKTAEKVTGQNLTKPHPYMFLKALLGSDYPDEKIVEGDYSKSKMKRVLAVGDAGADILSAHGAGMDFCAVLTGVSGKAARAYFEKGKAEYILDSLEDFLTEKKVN